MIEDTDFEDYEKRMLEEEGEDQLEQQENLRRRKFVQNNVLNNNNNNVLLNNNIQQQLNIPINVTVEKITSNSLKAVKELPFINLPSLYSKSNNNFASLNLFYTQMISNIDRNYYIFNYNKTDTTNNRMQLVFNDFLIDMINRHDSSNIQFLLDDALERYAIMLMLLPKIDNVNFELTPRLPNFISLLSTMIIYKYLNDNNYFGIDYNLPAVYYSLLLMLYQKINISLKEYNNPVLWDLISKYTNNAIQLINKNYNMNIQLNLNISSLTVFNFLQLNNTQMMANIYFYLFYLNILTYPELEEENMESYILKSSTDIVNSISVLLLQVEQEPLFKPFDSTLNLQEKMKDIESFFLMQQISGFGSSATINTTNITNTAFYISFEAYLNGNLTLNWQQQKTLVDVQLNSNYLQLEVQQFQNTTISQGFLQLILNMLNKKYPQILVSSSQSPSQLVSQPLSQPFSQPLSQPFSPSIFSQPIFSPSPNNTYLNSLLEGKQDVLNIPNNNNIGRVGGTGVGIGGIRGTGVGGINNSVFNNITNNVLNNTRAITTNEKIIFNVTSIKTNIRPVKIINNKKKNSIQYNTLGLDTALSQLTLNNISLDIMDKIRFSRINENFLNNLTIMVYASDLTPNSNLLNNPIPLIITSTSLQQLKISGKVTIDVLKSTGGRFFIGIGPQGKPNVTDLISNNQITPLDKNIYSWIIQQSLQMTSLKKYSIYNILPLNTSENLTPFVYYLPGANEQLLITGKNDVLDNTPIATIQFKLQYKTY